MQRARQGYWRWQAQRVTAAFLVLVVTDLAGAGSSLGQAGAFLLALGAALLSLVLIRPPRRSRYIPAEVRQAVLRRDLGHRGGTTVASKPLIIACLTQQLMERPLGELRLCTVLIDGTPFKDRQMIVALGIGCDGRKTVLCLREGATENATVVGALLSDLLERGLDFTMPRLYVLDGGRALHAAVLRHAGESAFIQGCQIHEKRKVVDHLPEEHKADVRRKLQNACSMNHYTDAQSALERLHHELMHLNPSAVRSLEEGLEETLTVHKLHVPDQLRRTLCCINVIESAFSIVETVCRNVKRWRDGD